LSSVLSGSGSAWAPRRRCLADHFEATSRRGRGNMLSPSCRRSGTASANQGGRRRAVAAGVVNETGIRKRQGRDRTARGSARQKGRHSTCDGRSSAYSSRLLLRGSVTGRDPQAPATLWIMIIRQHWRNSMLHSASCLEVVLLVTLCWYLMPSALGNPRTNQTRTKVSIKIDVNVAAGPG